VHVCVCVCAVLLNADTAKTAFVNGYRLTLTRYPSTRIERATHVFPCNRARVTWNTVFADCGRVLP